MTPPPASTSTAAASCWSRAATPRCMARSSSRPRRPLRSARCSCTTPASAPCAAMPRSRLAAGRSPPAAFHCAPAPPTSSWNAHAARSLCMSRMAAPTSRSTACPHSPPRSTRPSISPALAAFSATSATAAPSTPSCRPRASASTCALRQSDSFARRALAVMQVIRAHGEVRHPTEPDLSFLYGVILTDDTPPASPRASRHFCVFGEGQIDRSATGSGVTARMAVDAARGLIAPGAARAFAGASGLPFHGRTASRGAAWPASRLARPCRRHRRLQRHRDLDRRGHRRLARWLFHRGPITIVIAVTEACACCRRNAHCSIFPRTSAI